MQKSSYVKRIANALAEQDYLVTTEPDHPMLLAGPDMLAAKDGRLLAFFYLRTEDRRIGDSVLVRLALSRLALPRHTQCVFLYDERTSEEGERFFRHFHYMFSLRDFAQASRALGDRNENNMVQEVPRDIQARVFANFEFNYAESASGGVERAPFELEPSEIISSLSSRPDFAPGRLERWGEAGDVAADGGESELEQILEANDAAPPPDEQFVGEEVYQSRFFERRPSPFLVNRDGMAFAAISSRRREVNRRKIKDLAIYLTRFLYVLDNGVPYPRPDTASAGFLIASEVPTLSRDPMKVTRAAAFSGWIIAPPAPIEQIVARASGVRMRLRVRLNEVLV